MIERFEIDTANRHTITSSVTLCCAETGRVIAVFYNDYDAEALLAAAPRPEADNALSHLRTAWQQHTQSNVDRMDWFDICAEIASFREDSRPVPDLPVAITPDEMKSLSRFCETCEDGQDYDVSVRTMQKLAEIGLVRRTTASRYEITNFGLAVTAGKVNARPAQPEQPAPIKTGPSGKTMWTATMPDRRKKPASIPAVNQRCEIGIYGKSWDGPEATRAYTHEHQPDNVVASRLGRAVYKARQHTPGDHIDLGLYLLRELMDVGFGVFELPRPAAPGGE